MATYDGWETFDRLFRRCVQCDSGTPSCPTCDSGYTCQLSSASCYSCASTSCVIDTTTSNNSSSSGSGGPNVGAIAGGVVAGVAAIAIVTYLVWRFCIKTRRQQYEQENWIEELEGDAVPQDQQEKAAFDAQRNTRASTYTVGSIASTVLTRASNIIQIAYIPGVTNRGGPPTSPGLLVPPVPPIPIALGSQATTPAYDDQHFFMPGDLRDSTYSGVTDRTSFARTSIASTIYGKNAIISPVPAQTSKVFRGKAAMVSVGSKGPGGSLKSGEVTPPVPSLDFSKYTDHGPPSPAFSVGSTFLTNANAATAVKPTMVNVSAQKPSNLSTVQSASGSSSAPSLTEFPSAPTAASTSADKSRTKSTTTLTTFIDDTTSPNTPSSESQGPFSDPKDEDEARDKATELSKAIQAATKKATARPVSGLAARTPFGDENATE